ncbi:MAG: AmmeMemoRadiSam system protein B [Planctomycetes bacterium]|nr:AmmeMemoRadiSam system protein B [Planctomycetota bacterium]
MTGMLLRKPFRAGSFYPRTASEVEKALDEMAKAAPKPAPGISRAAAAIAPHAGWTFSGPTAYTAARTLLTYSEPRTIVVFGAVHNWSVRLPTITEADAWLTPLGPLPVDTELRDTLLGAGLPVEADEHAHNGEHSIEVLLPMVQALSGAVKVLPIAMPPVRESIEVGRALAGAGTEEGDVVVLASTDLTHYGADYYGWAPMGAGPEALKWVREENDAAVIQAMLDMDEERVMERAREDRSACGAGAAAAAIAFAKGTGATAGRLLDYTTSYDVRPDGEPSDFVGYAAVVLGTTI